MNKQKVYTHSEAVDVLMKYIDANFKTQTQAAKSFGVSKQCLSMVKHGSRYITPRMLKAIGMKRLSGYVEDE